jgi:hypothetical protein
LKTGRSSAARAAEHLGDRLLRAGVRVGDDELDARESALDERAQDEREKASVSASPTARAITSR